MSDSVDMAASIKAKADQLNADDLISGPITVSVTGVKKGSAEQPVIIAISGGHQPFKPCKTMRRMIVAAWGADAGVYAGRSMTLYRNPKVRFGGEEVGGIEISHLSHIKEPVELSLSVSRGKKKKYIVNPLKDAVIEWNDKLTACDSLDALKALGKQLAAVKTMAKSDLDSLRSAYKSREAELSQPDATETNRQHEPYTAILARINAAPNGQQAGEISDDINSAAESGELTSDEANELRAKLSAAMN